MSSADTDTIETELAQALEAALHVGEALIVETVQMTFAALVMLAGQVPT